MRFLERVSPIEVQPSQPEEEQVDTFVAVFKGFACTPCFGGVVESGHATERCEER
jgi:hypothetical protein